MRGPRPFSRLLQLTHDPVKEVPSLGSVCNLEKLRWANQLRLSRQGEPVKAKGIT